MPEEKMADAVRQLIANGRAIWEIIWAVGSKG